MTKNAFLNFAHYCGAIWRRRENRHMGAQLQSLLCIMAQKLENLLPVWLLVHTQSWSFRAFFGLFFGSADLCSWH